MTTSSEPTVTVTVLRLLPFGILVRLSNGGEGLIRERELGWDHWDLRHWRHQFKVGDSLRALVLGPGLDQRCELSLRFAEHDPWAHIATRLRLGQVVDGTITGVQPYGAFVQLEPGITGLLHVSRLPTWAQHYDPTEHLWVGDRLRLGVERIDPKNRQIGLSLRHALLQRWTHAPQAASNSPTIEQTAATTEADATQPGMAEHPPPHWRVLVIEDDPAQLQAMTQWLEQAGHQPWSATSAEAALALLEANTPDLLLSDFGLPALSGAELLQRVCQRWPTLRCALMTDWARASEHLAVIDQLRARGVHLLLKPLRPHDLADLLSASLAAPVVTATPPLALPLPATPAGQTSPELAGLTTLLARLCQTTAANQAVLFALDPAQRKVRIVATAGGTELKQVATVDLIHSPVRDVAEDQQIFKVDDADLAETRVRYLKPLLTFRTCYGIRLPAQLAEQYALFIFSPRPAAFQELQLAYVDATALALAALLERERFQAQAIELQRLSLLGQLSRALVHELNHQLSPVNFVLNDIAQQFEQLRQPIDTAPGTAELDVMQELVEDLNRSVTTLTATAQMFGRVTVQAKEQVIDMRAQVEEVLHLLRDMADRAHVQLLLQVADDMPPVRIHVAQLQQILLNILINAIQQVALAHGNNGGMVLVRIEQASNGQRPTFRIQVEDDGPGIHRRLWQRIFELGFTTRLEGGSGLGLYITRSLVEALGGQVSVAESLMLWGTTFVVELPLQSG